MRRKRWTDVSSQLEDLSGQVLEDGGEVDGSSRSDSLGVVSLLEQSVNSSDGELKSGLQSRGEGGMSARVGRRQQDEGRTRLTLADLEVVFLSSSPVAPTLPDFPFPPEDI